MACANCLHKNIYTSYLTSNQRNNLQPEEKKRNENKGKKTFKIKQGRKRQKEKPYSNICNYFEEITNSDLQIKN